MMCGPHLIYTGNLFIEHEPHFHSDEYSLQKEKTLKGGKEDFLQIYIMC